MSGPADELIDLFSTRLTDQAHQVAAEAYQEAREEVRSLLKAAMKSALLRAALAHIDHGSPLTASEMAPTERETAELSDHRGSKSAAGETTASVSAAEVACYVCGVCFDDQRVREYFAAYEGSQRLRTVASDGLLAVVRLVSVEEFSPDALVCRAGDLKWLEAEVSAHDTILKCAAEMTPVVPLRFGTIFRDEDALRDWLSQRRVELGGLLDYLRDKEEWGLKVFVKKALLSQQLEQQSAELQQLRAKIASAGSGAAYLLERQYAELRARLWTEALRAHVTGFHERYRALAVAAVSLPLHRVQSGSVNKDDSADEEMVLNASYLMLRRDVSRLRESIVQTDSEPMSSAFRVELTGPWPAYNFSTFESLAEASGEPALA